MSSAVPAIPTAARSMLEEMLAALKLKDEKPKDVPPALPSRPTLKRRPPSTKHILPTKLKIDEAAECSQKGSDGTPNEKPSSSSTELSNGINKGTDSVEKAGHCEAEELDCFEKRPDGGCNGYAQEDSDKNNQKVHRSSLEELEKLTVLIKEELRQKEEENFALLQQVQQYEKKWSQCEEKMNSMEEMYQKQLEALKMSLTEAQKTIAAAAAADTVEKPGKFDSEGAKFAAARTPEEAPARHYVSSAPPTRDADDRNNVQQLAREFEKQKLVFEDEVRALDALKSGQPRSATEAIDELRKLKSSYKAWKKEYKVRLRDTKKSLVKLARSSAEKPRRRWWCSYKCYKKKEKK